MGSSVPWLDGEEECPGPQKLHKTPGDWQADRHAPGTAQRGEELSRAAQPGLAAGGRSWGGWGGVCRGQGAALQKMMVIW